MTADLTTLRALKARVDAATGANHRLDADLCEALTYPPNGHDATVVWVCDATAEELAAEPRWVLMWRDSSGEWMGFAPPLTASIDAAVGLVERVLPQRRFIDIEIHPSSADVEISMGYGDEWSGNDNDRTAPLAVLSALLTALITQAEAAAEEHRT